MNDEEIAALATLGQRMVNAADTIVRQRDLIDELRKQNGERALELRQIVKDLRELPLALRRNHHIKRLIDRYDTEVEQ